MGLDTVMRLLQTDVTTLFASKGQLLGLDIGSSSIKAVQMKENRGAYSLIKFGRMPLEPNIIVDGMVVDGTKVVQAIKDLVKDSGIKLKNVAMSISGHSVIVKKVSVPPSQDDELEMHIRQAAEQYIPFDINEVNLDYHVLPSAPSEVEAEPQMSVLVVAAKKEKINELTELVRGAGLKPVVMDVDAFAIENMYGINYPIAPEEIVALVNIGASVMTVNVMKGGTSMFTRDISLGGNRYNEALQRQLLLTYEQAESAKRGEIAEDMDKEGVSTVVDDVNAEVASEIARSIDYFKTTAAEGDIQKIALCGGCGKVTGLTERLHERMGVEVELLNPFNQIDTESCDLDPEQLAEFAPEAAVGVGLAFRTIGDR